MLIRTEAPSDLLMVDRLLKQNSNAFLSARTMKTLRENGQITLSLVACADDGHLIGHVAVTPVTLNDEDHGWQMILPVTAAEEVIDGDIVFELLHHALETLGEFGYPAAFMWGEIKTNQGLPFQLADTLAIECHARFGNGVLLCAELYPEVCHPYSGCLQVCSELQVTESSLLMQ